MLAALFLAFFLGGAAGGAGSVINASMLAGASERIEAAVKDPARSKAATAAAQDLEDTLKSFDKTFTKAQKDVTKMFKDHSAGAQEMAAPLDALEQEWLAAQNKALDLRFEMKESLTREEWNQVFGQ